MIKGIKLNSSSITSIEKSTGMTYKEMIGSSAEEIDRRIESKYKTRLSYNRKKKDLRIMSRGSVFVALRRYLLPVSDRQLERLLR